MRLDEEGGNISEEGLQEVGARAGMKTRAHRSRHAMPVDLVISTPGRHGEGSEVPQNGPKGHEPLSAQHRIVTG